LTSRSLGEGWPELAEHVAETLDIGPGTRIFEVDCHNGELLFPLYSNGYIVGGTDGDPEAIAHALTVMPDGVFSVGMASALDPAMPWDVVICRSLAGAPDLDYVRGLVARMFAKATHGIALLNVPEKHHRALLHALAEVGAKAIQIEGLNLYARV
jgi:2-polyprenyl-3-methyl-5-hydroxy-6-metoxy-1,4-benzoquinol methylase